jgi:hypothetical protein
VQTALISISTMLLDAVIVVVVVIQGVIEQEVKVVVLEEPELEVFIDP